VAGAATARSPPTLALTLAQGAKSKAGKKKDEEEARKADAARAKAEAKRLADAEERELAETGKKGGKTAPPKVTVAQLAAAAEAEAAARDAAVRSSKKAARKEVSEQAYDSLVSTRNTNRVEDVIEASGVDAALTALERLEVDDEEPGSTTPRGGRGGLKLKAAWSAYEEANMGALQEEKPGLKSRQYQALLFKQWQRAPENPLNIRSMSGGPFSPGAAEEDD